MQFLKRILGHSHSKNKYLISSVFNVEETSKRFGGELVAEVLKFYSHDVTEVFTLCGGHISPILVSCEKLGIRVVDTRHEVSTVYAADAVARLKQSIGVAAVTSGPGITNTITAVKNAQMAESPILLIGGAAPTLMKGRGALQDIDQLSILRPLCKFTERVNRLRDIQPMIRKAIQVAKSGTPGPVFIEFPLDVLCNYETAGKDCYIPNATGVKKLFNAYCLYHISKMFSNAWKQQPISPLPTEFPVASSEDVDSMVNIISQAKRPILLMGTQATLPPVGAKQLQVTVKEIGMPTYLGGMCRGLLGINCQIHLRHNRRDALKDADVIILAGTVADFRLDYGKILSPNSKVISINRDTTQLKKNLGVYWTAEKLVQADIGTALVEVSKKLTAKAWKSPPDWLKKLKEKEVAKEQKNQKKMNEPSPDGKLNPLKLLGQLDKVIPEDAILVADGGDFVGSAAHIVRPRGPLQWLDPGAFGTLGVGGGFALGAKTAFPNKLVIIIYGDGSAGYSIMEFDSFVRMKMPVVGVIGNDACWTQIAREQVPIFKSAISCDLAFNNYERIGQALGTDGILLTNEDESKIEKYLRVAIDASRTGKSTVINANIGRTNFREGSLSV